MTFSSVGNTHGPSLTPDSSNVDGRQQPQELENDFAKSAQLIADGKVEVPSVADRLRLYALYSVVKKGTPPKRAPSQWLEPTAHAKWTAWSTAAHMTACDAMREYNERVHQYLTTPNSAGNGRSSQNDGFLSFGSRAIAGFTLGPTPSDDSSSTWDNGDENDIGVCAADGNVEEVLALLSHDKSLVNWRDEEGLTPLMRAADRDALDVVKILLNNGADVTMTDNEGLTALHYAALCNHPRSAALLVQHGACPFTKDLQGHSAIDTAEAATKLVIYQTQKTQASPFTLHALTSKPTTAAYAIAAIAATAFLAWYIRIYVVLPYPSAS